MSNLKKCSKPEGKVLTTFEIMIEMRFLKISLGESYPRASLQYHTIKDSKEQHEY
jgi:hypothetical protein